MGVVDWVILVVATVVGLALGLVFGAFPMKTAQMTENQQKYSSAIGIVAVGVLIILIIVHQDLPSWFEIGALIVGFAIAKIPALHSAILKKFKFFRPKPAQKSTRGSRNGSASSRDSSTKSSKARKGSSKK
jgi:ABC-type tungstate transport system substrate-binding protein